MIGNFPGPQRAKQAALSLADPPPHCPGYRPAPSGRALGREAHPKRQCFVQKKERGELQRQPMPPGREQTQGALDACQSSSGFQVVI